jgi:hypothetical protein
MDQSASGRSQDRPYGAPAPAPIRKVLLKLKEPYVGWEVECRSNPSLGQLRALATTDLETQIGVLSKIVSWWNWVDEDGKQLPQPNEPGAFDEIDVDMLTAFVGEYTASMNDKSAVPKASKGRSGSS